MSRRSRVLGRDWPLTGRDRELDAIMAAAADDGSVTGVLVGGQPGLGKTRLAREALLRLAADGWHTEWVVATRSAWPIPCSAIAHLLPRGDTPPDGRLALTRAVAERVGGWGGRGRVAIVVDDANLLDPSSAAVIGHLAARRLAFLIFTRRDGQALPDFVSGLLREGGAIPLDLTALASEAIDELIGHGVDGTLDGPSRHRLHALASGNPFVLAEVLRAGLASGALARRYGVWRLEGPVLVSGQLAELVATRMRELDDETRLVLELLACGEPLSMTVLESLAGAQHCATAEKSGLVVVEPDGVRMRARLAHPVYAEAFRAMMPAATRRRRFRQLANLTLQGPLRRRDDAMRVALWQVEAGTITRPDLLAEAARQAVGWSGLDLAERLARAARAAAPGQDTDRLLAQILIYRGRGDVAATVMPTDSVASHGVTGPAAQAVTSAELAYWGAGDAGAAERTLTRAAAAPDGEVADGARTWILLFDGQCAAAVSAARAVLAKPGAQAQGVIWAAAAGTAAAGFLGREAESAALSERGMAIARAHEEQIPWGVVQIGYGRCLALLATGDLDRARALAEQGYRAVVGSGVPFMPAVWTWLRGLNELARGHPASADTHLREALAVLEDNDGFKIARCCMAALAAAAALTGDGAAARSWLERADRRPRPWPRLFEPQISRWRSWVLAAEGAASEAAEAAREAASLADGIPGEELLARFELARLGQHRDVGRLAELADRVGSAFAAALRDGAEALGADDGAALATAAGTLAGLGHDLLAAELSAAAARACWRSGLHAWAGVYSAQAAALAAQCPDAKTPLLGSLPFSGLTPREREVLHLAATYPSKQIAERLGLSVRTVDNALSRAYSKLGLHGREDLRLLLAEQ